MLVPQGSEEQVVFTTLEPIPMIIGSFKQSTGDFKVPKYSDWKRVLVHADEEDRDYVARTYYLKSTTPREAEDDASEEFSNYFGSSSSSDDYDMDLDLEDVLRSPTCPIKKSKKRATLIGDALGSTQEPLKRIKKTTNKKRATKQLTIEQEESLGNSTAPSYCELKAKIDDNVGVDEEEGPIETTTEEEELEMGVLLSSNKCGRRTVVDLRRGCTCNGGTVGGLVAPGADMGCGVGFGSSICIKQRRDPSS
uniref:Uncharacterized protein n=1 Tax=Cannabis sativa TaxID=3483 RepID=A0A803QPK9_CANSA